MAIFFLESKFRKYYSSNCAQFISFTEYCICFEKKVHNILSLSLFLLDQKSKAVLWQQAKAKVCLGVKI